MPVIYDLGSLFANSWHWAVPQLVHLGIIVNGLQKNLSLDGNLINPQAQALNRISTNLKTIHANWRLFAKQATRQPQEQFLEFFFKRWESGFTPFDGIMMAIDSLLIRGFVHEKQDEDYYDDLKELKRHYYKARDQWQHMREYLEFEYTSEIVWEWKPILLSEVIDQATSYLYECYGIDKVEVSLPDNLPAVQGNEWLSRAMVNIVSTIHYVAQGDAHELDGNTPSFEGVDFSYLRSTDFICSIQAKLKDDLQVLVQIRNSLADEATEQREFPFTSSLFFPSSYLRVAGAIIERYSNEAKLYISNQAMEIWFTLEPFRQGL